MPVAAAGAVIGLAVAIEPDDATSGPASRAAIERGSEVFAAAGCSACHTLADAGATGDVGPSLDGARPSQGLVVSRVTNGEGLMPAFAGKLSQDDIDAVAAYVAAVAGKER